MAEKISEVAFLYEDPGRHAQPHTNHKPVFAELADLVKNVFLILYSVFLEILLYYYKLKVDRV